MIKDYYISVMRFIIILLSISIAFSQSRIEALKIQMEGKLKFTQVFQGVLVADPIIDEENNIFLLTDNKVLRLISKTGVIKKSIQLNLSVGNNFFMHPNGSIYIGLKSGFLQIYDNKLNKIVTVRFNYNKDSKMLALSSGRLLQINKSAFSIYTHLGEKLLDMSFDEDAIINSVARQYNIIVVPFKTKVEAYTEDGYKYWTFLMSGDERVKSVINVEEGFYVTTQYRNILLGFKGNKILENKYLVNNELDKDFKDAIPIFAVSDGSIIYKKDNEILYFKKDYTINFSLNSLLKGNFIFSEVSNDGFLILGDKSWLVYGLEIFKDDTKVVYSNSLFNKKFKSYSKFRNGNNIFDIWLYKDSFIYNYYDAILQRKTLESYQEILDDIKKKIDNKNLGGKISLYEYFLYRIISDMYTRPLTSRVGSIENDYPYLRAQALYYLSKISSFSTVYKVAYLINLEKNPVVLEQYANILGNMLLDVNGDLIKWLLELAKLDPNDKRVMTAILNSIYKISFYSGKSRQKDLLNILEYINKNCKVESLLKNSRNLYIEIKNRDYDKDII